ncbi:MAG TPA: FlgD immunoglobulin-like domain containing protein [Saprospiraceae bacterium]|nr:FlgD immunoglobulin-like domain containing protein [Saprospiraceae bacterium]HMQ83108.1 FlgD immunoglobulin-like domain containing protein [Saprospiraceae bacterium]
MNYTRNLLQIGCLLLWTGMAYTQVEEQNASPAYFNPPNLGLDGWTAYFEDHYFSRGIQPSEMGEGSGYLPYVREKWFYDLRKTHTGDAGGLQRWKTFQAMRQKMLGRGGTNPVANWQNVGPNKMEGQGGRMISHAFDPHNTQIIWAGSASGGLWLSEDGGDSWQPMTDQIPSTGIGAVAVNPLNSNAILIGTGEGYTLGSSSIRPGLGVFKSIDFGQTWEQTDFDYLPAAGVSVFQLAWSYADTSTVWLAASNGIWKSTDAGMTWVLKKGDGTNQQTAICNDILQHPTNPDLLYASFDGNGIWRSSDAGENWSKLSGGLPTSDMDFIDLSLCRSQPNVLYASIASGINSLFNLKGLYKTDDGGDTWVKLENAPEAFCVPNAIPGVSFCQGWYDNVVAVSPQDPDVVWLGGTTLWRSVDGGESWTQHDRYFCPNCTEPPACRTYVDQHDFAFDPLNPQTVYVFNDGGIAKSTNGGDCWEQKNEGLITAQFYALSSGRSDPGVIIGGFQDHGLQGIRLWENTNLAWDRWGFLDGSDVEVHATDANILYGAWVNGTYWRTTFGVHTLSVQITNGINLSENNGFFFAPIRQNPQDPAVLLGCTMQRLYRTTNSGGFWLPVATINEPRVFEFDQNDPTNAYAAAWINNGNSSFWRSQDGGATWSTTANSPGWRVTDVKSSPLQAGLVYASRNSINANTSHIYKSSNFGNTWGSIQGDLPDLSVNALAIHPFVSGVLFAATDLGVFITLDDGQTWTEYNDNLPVTFIMDIEFNPADTTLRVGTHGRGAWMTKAWMPEDVTSVHQHEEPSFGILNIYPNPVSTTMQIDFYLDKADQVRVEIVDVLGQNIAHLPLGNQAAGTHQVSWDGKSSRGMDIPPGSYFVRLIVGNQVRTNSFVKL